MTHSNTNSRQATAILLLILAQPFLDVISYWLNTSGSENTLTLALRLALLPAFFTVRPMYEPPPSSSLPPFSAVM